MPARLTAVLLAAGLLAATLSAQPAPSSAPSVGSRGSAAAYTLSPEKRAQAVAYSRARYTLHFVGFLWSVLVLIVVVALRLGPRFRDRAEAASRRRFWQAAVFVPLLLL